MKDNLKIPRGPQACVAGQGRAFRPVSSETPSSTGSRTVFFLNMGESRRIPQLKLAGIRRFAAAKGWTVRAFPESESTIGRVRALLRRERPLGCIVQYSSRRRTLPPELFAGVPAVWLECPPAFFGRGVPNACTDQTAVAREAFREIVSLRSAAVASVGYATSAFGPSWSDRRMAAFASLCEETGWPLHSFVYRGAMPQQGDRSPSAMRKLAAWIAALPRGTAVFAANDDLAAAVVDAAISAGRRIGVRLADGAPLATPGNSDAALPDMAVHDPVRGTFAVSCPRTAGGFAPSGAIEAGPLRFEIVEGRKSKVESPDTTDLQPSAFRPLTDGSGEAAAVPTTIWASSVDGAPLAASSRILLSHVTDSQNTDAVFEDPGMRIWTSYGRLPALVRRGAAEVSLAVGPGPWKIWRLSPEGLRIAAIPSLCDDTGRLRFTVRTDYDPAAATICYEIAR